MRLLLLASLFFSSASFAQDLTPPTSGCPGNLTCSGHGICFPNDDTCTCEDGYITLPGQPSCGYEQKRWVVATMLQLFAGFSGAANWYIERNAYAAGQLILALSLVPLGVATTSVFKADGVPTWKKALVTSLLITDFVAGFVWWAVDVDRFVKGEITDGNGQSLVR